jgi:hypothetical protein
MEKRTMFNIRLKIVTAALAVALASATARADWPKRVFAPYVYLGNGDNFRITDCNDAIGLKHYTLAFIIADKHNDPSWFGEIPMNRNFYADQIAAIRQRGGDVICSFGGADGREIAIAEKDPNVLQAKYQAVIDQYKFTWLDFDIEGSNLDKNPEANKRRNSVLASLQRKNSGLVVSYTLPVDPNGISQASRDLLADAKAKGVTVHSANIMVMFFGADFLRGGKKEADVAIASANKAREQISSIDPNVLIGLCPCIGTNGSREEIFNLDDARVLRAFADKTDWVCSLSYWSMNRDSEKNRGEDTSSDLPLPSWAFANTFKSFTSPADLPSRPNDSHHQ